MQVDDLGEEEGLDAQPKATKIALIDSDTIVYAACVAMEEVEDLLARDFYSDEEWAAITADPGYNEEHHCIAELDIEDATLSCVHRIEEIKFATFCKDAELFFTSGKNFRHIVDPMYKANRKSTRYPVGLKEVREALLEKYTGCIGKDVEADDMIVYEKRVRGNDVVLCAVDKDVLYAVPGKHYNYQRIVRFGIEPMWVEVDRRTAQRFPYLQTLMGDSTDNIRGCPGIGPKKAEKALHNKDTSLEMWEAVIKLYTQKKLTVKDAIMTMRLVSMTQVEKTGPCTYKWLPWSQPLC